jgi:hypothetical protein
VIALCVQYFKTMIRRTYFEAMTANLMAKALRSDLFLSPERMGPLFQGGRLAVPVCHMDLEEINTQAPDHLIGWLFADRPQPLYPV